MNWLGVLMVAICWLAMGCVMYATGQTRLKASWVVGTLGLTSTIITARWGIAALLQIFGALYLLIGLILTLKDYNWNPIKALFEFWFFLFGILLWPVALWVTYKSKMTSKDENTV